jgi:hypothetical protein
MKGSAKLSPLSVHHDPPTAGQVVIATGNAACRKARPSSAGVEDVVPEPSEEEFADPDGERAAEKHDPERHPGGER